jgi:Flp pilus assembly protein TadB
MTSKDPPRAVEEGAREPRRRDRPQGMVPARERRRTGIERGVMRAIATAGIVGIGVALGAVLVGQDVAGWIVGLVVSLVSIILAALLWSSRQL